MIDGGEGVENMAGTFWGRALVAMPSWVEEAASPSGEMGGSSGANAS